MKEQNKDSETVSKPDIRGVSDKNIDNEKQKLNQEIKVEKVDSTKIKQQETQVSSQAASLKDYVAEVSIKLNENWQPPKSGQNTQTIVILTIGEDGSLQKYDIAKSSGDEATDRSIISAAEKSVPYQFSYTAFCTLPALKQEVQTLILLTVPFTLTFTDCKLGSCV